MTELLRDGVTTVAIPLRSTEQFHLFTKLPIELRGKIWKLNLPGPRVLEVYQRRVEPDHLAAANLSPGSHKDLLRLVKTCRESSNMVLKEYRKVPREAFRLLGMKPGSMFLVNYERDVLFFHTNLRLALDILRNTDPRERKRVETVMFLNNDVEAGIIDALTHHLFKYKSLREISLAADGMDTLFRRNAPLIWKTVGTEYWKSPGFGRFMNKQDPKVEERIESLKAPWTLAGRSSEVEITFSRLRNRDGDGYEDPVEQDMQYDVFEYGWDVDDSDEMNDSGVEDEETETDPEETEAEDSESD